MGKDQTAANASPSDDTFGKVEDEAWREIVNDVCSHKEQFRQDYQHDRLAAGLKELDPRPPKGKKNIPACDWCGAEAKGTKSCSQCQCVFYCSAKCQKADWKTGGHKKACATMKEEATQTAKMVVEKMKNATGNPFDRVSELGKLDRSSAYDLALEYGLMGAVFDCFQYDIEHSRENFLGKNGVSLTQWIVCTLFRGHRISRSEYNTFGKVDGSRILDYLAHRPDAFESWFNAVMAVIALPFEQEIFASKQYHMLVHQTARDCIAGFQLVWINGRASQAIMEAGNDMERQAKRLKLMATSFHRILQLCWKYDNDGRDYNSVLEGNLNQILGMVDLRRREFGIKSVDPVAVCKLRGIKLTMYQRVGLPMARATIQKGRMLTNDEARLAMMMM